MLNFSYNKLNTYLGRPKYNKFDDWFNCRTQFIFTMYNDLQCLPEIYASDLAHEKFNVWNEVAPWLKFPCGPLELNSSVDPN